ncbi:MAG: DUF4350 domain-containing protein [Thermodesulfobacteriota bacterium]
MARLAVRRWSPYCGTAGLVLLLLGFLGLGMAPMYKGFYVIPWTLATVSLAVYAAFNPDRIKGFLASRGARYGAGSAAGVILVLGILIFTAVLTNKHNVRYDLTSSRRHSLSDQTLKVLKALAVPVKVTGFFQSGGAMRERGKDLFERYAQTSSNFQYDLVDPDRFPAQAKSAGVTRYDTVVVEASKNSEKITDLSEERVTNAIIRVTRPGKKAIYFLTGHGEKDLSDSGRAGFSAAKTALTDQSYEVKTLLLMQSEDVPLDAAVLIVAGPRKEPLPQEFEALDRFLRRGGHVLFLVDPESGPELAAFLKRFNVKVGFDVIVDKMSRLYGADYLMPLVSHYSRHPVTEHFTLASFFPMARSISVDREKVEGVKVTVLASASDKSWGETDLVRLGRGSAEYEEGKDLKGPVPVAVVGTINPAGEAKKATPEKKDTKNKEGKFIVFGDSDFASNAYMNLQGNGDLFLSSVNWLAEEADLLAIRPKDKSNRPLMLSQLQVNMVFWLAVVIMPLGVMTLGLSVILARRKEQ